ncbi:MULTISPECIES: hypothetical protein [unclassified Vibrio]|uniref:hypothetical protein n=1 Tax=unclassified Vibrio TaxID=2614977 RepID=UPI0014822742|nr:MULTISPECIES: hypothetical protein [unclassified Vibrio]MDQ2192867.1 hypothetical protein [Vibrio sp. A14(2019)]MDQ2197962.1 hypothetical protein [Vibrio sp. 2017_1457_11]NNN75959.1 hypothetical protein [Vibrio sp. B7]NNN93861.1 hypothetical protein [Vibrio sp. B8-1]NNO08223.1 hypothetical protein [Vibrio sp. B4-12]
MRLGKVVHNGKVAIIKAELSKLYSTQDQIESDPTTQIDADAFITFVQAINRKRFPTSSLTSSPNLTPQLELLALGMGLITSAYNFTKSALGLLEKENLVYVNIVNKTTQAFFVSGVKSHTYEMDVSPSTLVPVNGNTLVPISKDTPFLSDSFLVNILRINLARKGDSSIGAVVPLRDIFLSWRLMNFDYDGKKTYGACVSSIDALLDSPNTSTGAEFYSYNDDNKTKPDVPKGFSDYKYLAGSLCPELFFISPVVGGGWDGDAMVQGGTPFYLFQKMYALLISPVTKQSSSNSITMNGSVIEVQVHEITEDIIRK